MDAHNDNPYQSPTTPMEEVPEAGPPQLASRITRLVASIVDSIVDILFIFGSERRCVHDLIAGTKVVEA